MSDSRKCQDCARYRALDRQHGECICEQVDLKGGRFWFSRPVKAEKESCQEFTIPFSEN